MKRLKSFLRKIAKKFNLGNREAHVTVGVITGVTGYLMWYYSGVTSDDWVNIFSSVVCGSTAALVVGITGEIVDKYFNAGSYARRDIEDTTAGGFVSTLIMGTIYSIIEFVKYYGQSGVNC